MADGNSSPEIKTNARFNIMQALQNARRDAAPPATPPKPSSEEGEELDLERQKTLREVVKVLQLETRGPPAPAPPPAVKPRSPRHSPPNKSPVLPNKQGQRPPPKPARPPPPRTAPRRPPPMMPNTQSIPEPQPEFQPQPLSNPQLQPQPQPFPRTSSQPQAPPQTQPQPRQRSPQHRPEAEVAPPPIPITTIDIDSRRPKPVIRSRKKKYAPMYEPTRQSEFVELSTSDIIIECGPNGEDLKVIFEKNCSGGLRNPVGGSSGSPASGDGEVKREESDDEAVEGEEVGGGHELESEQANVEELDRDGWEVIQAESAPTVEESSPHNSEENSSPSPLHRDVSKIEDVVRTMTSRKKKPPPFRPAPYSSSGKTPPLPPKKAKKSVKLKEPDEKWSQLADQASATAIYKPVVVTSEETDSLEECRVLVQQEGDHVYESMETFDQNIDAEPISSPSPTPPSKSPVPSKHVSSSSLESSDQSDTLSVKSLQLPRAGTMSESMLRSKSSEICFSRPKSEVPVGGMGYGDLEASFEVIPQTGDLDSVMTSLRQTDEKYQDASIYDLIQACSKALPHVTSTAELPPRLKDFPDTSRAHVINELYTTEYTYVKGLEVLCEVFRDSVGPIIGEQSSQVFANVDDILSFNKSFLALLHSRLKELGPEARIGDLFIGMFTQAHKSMYAIYCSNYDSAEMMVTRLKKRSDFYQTLETSCSNSRVTPGLTLPAYLITPVQRIPRYILLLKDIVKHTTDSHPDKKSLMKALETMGELAGYIDAQVRESQTKKTFATLKNKVVGLADLDSPERNLVKEGQVYLKNVKKLYQCILFNDMLVFAHGDKQSKLELQLQLEAVWFEDLEDLDPQTSDEDAIEIYTPERPYTIYTRSKSEKRLWLNKLRDTIYHYLLKKGKCERSSTCSTVSRHATFVYSDGKVYNGHYHDSRRNGQGTMTWPNKTVYVGNWLDDERCGEGELKYNTGESYHGKWSEDKQNGFGELQFASNDVFRGHWKDGVRHGAGRIIYANGDKFEGHFVNGHVEGKGKLKCTNFMSYDGEWKHSQRHGKGKMRTCTKNCYEGSFSYDQIHGQGKMVYENQDTYTGSWKYGMRNGSGKFVSHKEGTYEGSWENDLRHGAGKQTYPNGDIFEGGWERNKRHSKGKMVYSTGMVYSGEFANDIICGEGEMYYGPDCKYQGSWVNGLRHGHGVMKFSDSSSYNGDWCYGMRHGQGDFVMSDGSAYRGQWANDKFHGKGTLSIAHVSYTYNGDWMYGKKEGRGDEMSQYGNYKGAWKADLKQGYGEERSLVGTIFDGNWDKGKKNGRGVRKMIFGTTDEQIWKSGQLTSDPTRMTAVELPFLSRNDT